MREANWLGERPDDRPVEVGRVAVDQPDHRSSEAVVHRRVGLVPEQPRRGVVPLLAEHQRVRIGRLHGLPDLAHEAVRQVVHDIEPPAGRSVRDPAPGDPVRTGEQVVDLAALDHLGDRVEPEPALVVGVGPVLGRRRAGRRLVRSRWAEREPAAVWRVGGLARPGVREALETVEPRRVGRDVVEDAVQQDPDAAGVGLPEERLEVRLGPEVRVDHVVAAGVVAVVRWRGEDRVEVEHRDAERLQVVELGGDPGQVAAEEVAPERLFVARGALVRAAVALRQVVPLLRQDVVAVHVAVAVERRAVLPLLRVRAGVVRRVAVEEAVREDLVDDGTAGPGRRREVGLVDVDLPRRVRAVGECEPGPAVVALRDGATVRREVVLDVAGRGPVADDEPVVEDRRLGRRLQRRLPVVVAVLALRRVGRDDLHRDERLQLLERVPHADRRLGQVAGRGTQPQRHLGPGRHGPVGHAIQVVAAVVGEVVVADLAVDRERWPVLRRDRRW